MPTTMKSISQFHNGAWSNPIPFSVDDTNIDITSATTDPNTDSSTDLSSSDVIVAEGDTGASAWTKFNRFRKRISNAFGTFTGKTLVSAYDTTNPGDKVYTASVLNSYMSNVLGYTGTGTPTINGSSQTVSSALNNIFGNGVKSISRSGTTFTVTRLDGTTFTFDQQDNNTTYSAASGGGLSLSGTAFSIANSGVTAGSYGPSANATPGYGATFNVPYITVDAKGKVTAASTKTVKIPASDNTNTWRGIQNNLTSTSTTDSLAAAQGTLLSNKIAVIEASYFKCEQKSTTLAFATSEKTSTFTFSGNLKGAFATIGATANVESAYRPVIMVTTMDGKIVTVRYKSAVACNLGVYVIGCLA